MCGVDGAMQVDHIYTIKDGFVNNIPPYIIGSHVNIQLVDWKTNDTKKDKSEITKDQLILLYSKIAHPEY